MNIQDIIDQEKQKELIRKSNLKQKKHLKKLFYKDCYKMWKDYKKVESPYFWWLGYFNLDIILLGSWGFYYWLRCVAPSNYIELGWFKNKWDFSVGDLGQTLIKHKSNPNNEWICLNSNNYVIYPCKSNFDEED